MKNEDVELNQPYYIAKVRNKIRTIRLDEKRDKGGWYATDMRTNKKVVIRKVHWLIKPAYIPKAQRQRKG